MIWHTQNSSEIASYLNTDQNIGLTSESARKSLEVNGYNELVEKGGRTAFRIIWEQLTATMVLILIVAAITAALLGDVKNAVAIGAIVILFTALGFYQEFRAEKAIAALKRMSVPSVRVTRNGEIREISSREVVPGDIIMLEAGNIVPADARLVSCASLKVQESALTGESDAVEKHADVLQAKDLPLGDRRNMVFMGTTAVYGRATAIAVSTGMKTELGHIANLLQQTENTQTPLQTRLDKLGNILAMAGMVIAGIIFLIGYVNGTELRQLLLSAVSIAVAVIPEGLPAVVTITLAIGSQRMLARNALIRKLPAVETLGSVTVICSDKTGTLTENRMTVVVLDTAGHELNLSEELKQDSVLTQKPQGTVLETPISLLTAGGVLCNDANLADDGNGNFHTIGDPTEGALLAVGARLGGWKNKLEKENPRIAEVAFDSERKRMTTFHSFSKSLSGELSSDESAGKTVISFTKGSPDGLLTVSTRVFADGKTVPMDSNWKKRIEDANARIAAKGMRVLGLAYKLWDVAPDKPAAQDENNLVFVGLFGMIDPPRKEVKDSIVVTKKAGIRTVMITGDQPLTANEIARQLGIQDGGRVVSGAELATMSEDQLFAIVNDVRVFARVSPEDKLKIVSALQKHGHIVSMTGDGVNDAPALRRADIGVAMGITGTDVSKEASDLVLLDDNFKTIVSAVQEGRTIYDNIRKFVGFSVAGNIGKVLVMLITPLLGKPIPLTPLQLLWLNLLTDGLLGLGLGVEPPESDTMSRPPFSPNEGVFSRGGGLRTAITGIAIGAVVLGIGGWYLHIGSSSWQTMIFCSLAFAQIGQALAARSNRDSLLTTGITSNPLMLLMVLMVAVLQLMSIYIEPMRDFFSTLALAPVDLAISIMAGVFVFILMEAIKKSSLNRA